MPPISLILQLAAASVALFASGTVSMVSAYYAWAAVIVAVTREVTPSVTLFLTPCAIYSGLSFACLCISALCGMRIWNLIEDAQ